MRCFASLFYLKLQPLQMFSKGEKKTECSRSRLKHKQADVFLLSANASTGKHFVSLLCNGICFTDTERGFQDSLTLSTTPSILHCGPLCLTEQGVIQYTANDINISIYPEVVSSVTWVQFTVLSKKKIPPNYFCFDERFLLLLLLAQADLFTADNLIRFKFHLPSGRCKSSSL